jgi:hypothetical protein
MPSYEDPSRAGEFRIYVMAPGSGLIMPGQGSSERRFMEIIKNAHTTDILIDDTEVYVWSKQQIVLTHQASTRLGLMTNYLDRIFVVTLKNQRLYGGITLFSGSARIVRLPVLSPIIQGERTVLVMMPHFPPHVTDEQHTDRTLQVEDVRRHFEALKKLR